MMRFKDPNHVESKPVSWRLNLDGKYYHIPWQKWESWPVFYAKVVTFTTGNNLPVPTEDEVQNIICVQFTHPLTWCTSDQTFHRPASVPRRPGCKSCGRR